MMEVKKYFVFVILALYAFLFAPYVVFAKPVSSTELINDAQSFDGKTVVYEGEAIGDIMIRKTAAGNYAWANLNDGQNAIGIWLPQALTKDIRFTGGYKSKGDWVEIIGIFHRACVEHGGDLDIHAQAIRIIQSGKATVERVNPAKKTLLFILSGILCLIIILRIFKRA